jgi:glutamate racemase
MDKRPIGIFDSGVGGLTVLKEIEDLLPNEDIVYFGDTARVPYGNKSKATILKFTTENILFLLKKKVKIVIIACNTASALALDSLRDVFNVPIIGVIEAGVVKALTVSKNLKVGVIGTRSTIGSNAYQNALLSRNKNIKIYAKSCPLFVPLAEEGMLSGEITAKVVDLYLKSFKKSRVDTIILGCTHYPLLKETIASYMGKAVIIDSAKEVAQHARIILNQHNLLNSKTKKGRCEFYASDETNNFSELAKMFLKRPVTKPRKTDV